MTFATPAPGAIHPDKPLRGASFGQAVKRLFQRYARFSGRASQSEFWWAYLFSQLLLLPGVIVTIASVLPLIGPYLQLATGTYAPEGLLGAAAGSLGLVTLGAVLTLVPALALLVPMLALTWRRFQDANLHGAIALCSFVTGIVSLVAGFLPANPAGVRFDTDAEGLAAKQAHEARQGRPPYAAQPTGQVPPYAQAQPYGQAQPFTQQPSEAGQQRYGG